MMPYTFEEVSACKDISVEKAIKDYQKLVSFPADHNPRKFCGNPCLYKYQLKNLLNCRREGTSYKILQEWFDDPELREKLWNDTIKRNRRDPAPYPNQTDVYECHRLNNGAIVPFKASTAKYIYKKYGATSILDPTMGWGGRLLGATSLGLDYIGFDTNIKLKEGYEQMISDLGLDEDRIHLNWTSSLDEEVIKKLDYDFVFTSPPYSNMEIYEGMTPFESDHIFYTEFLIPLMTLTMKYLKEGGNLCFNISPKMYKTLIGEYSWPECDYKEDLRQQLGQQFKTKSQDYVYIWKKDLFKNELFIEKLISPIKEHSSTNNITVMSNISQTEQVLQDLKKISDQRDRLLRKTRKQAKEIEEMKSEIPTICEQEHEYLKSQMDVSNQIREVTKSRDQQITDQQKEIKDLRNRNQVLQIGLNTLVKKSAEWDKQKKGR